MQETHSTKITEKQWQKESAGLSFWNCVPTNQTAGTAILFKEHFLEKIQNIKNDDAGRICLISFNLNKQHFHIINVCGPNKPYHWEGFFQSLTDYTANKQNTITGGNCNMIEELKDRVGGAICNTQLAGSEALTKIIKFQNLHDTSQKANLEKIEFSCHRRQS